MLLDVAFMWGPHDSMLVPSEHSDGCGGCSQVGIVKKGLPYIMFGDGRSAACKPISEADLARFMAECVSDRSKIDQVLPIGGEQPSCQASQDLAMFQLQICLLCVCCLQAVLQSITSALQHQSHGGRSGSSHHAMLHDGWEYHG